MWNSVTEHWDAVAQEVAGTRRTEDAVHVEGGNAGVFRVQHVKGGSETAVEIGASVFGELAIGGCRDGSARHAGGDSECRPQVGVDDNRLDATTHEKVELCSQVIELLRTCIPFETRHQRVLDGWVLNDGLVHEVALFDTCLYRLHVPLPLNTAVPQREDDLILKVRVVGNARVELVRKTVPTENHRWRCILVGHAEPPSVFFRVWIRVSVKTCQILDVFPVLELFRYYFSGTRQVLYLGDSDDVGKRHGCWQSQSCCRIYGHG